MAAPTPNYREAGLLLSAYGNRLGEEGDDARAQQALASAMAIAKYEGDVLLEMVTLISAAGVDLHQLRLHESGEKSLQALKLIDRLDDPLPGNEALFQLDLFAIARVHYTTGNLVEAQRYAVRLLAMMERIGDPLRLGHSLYLSGKLAALSGDWTTARQFCDRGLTLTPQHIFLLQVRALLEYAVGDFNQGETYLERMIEAYRAAGPEPGWVHAAVLRAVSTVAHMTGTTKHFDLAHAAAKTVLASKRVSPLWVWTTRTGLALMAAQLGETATVQEQYRALRGQRAVFGTMDVDRLLGLLAAASGELDHAASYFEAALATWGKGRYPEYAWTAYEYADMLFQRGVPGDQARAKHLLDDALTISRELGMVPMTERVLSRKNRADIR